MTAVARADSRWLAGFRLRDDAWWPVAAPLIEAHEYASAFTTYPWPAFVETPWAPVAKPVRVSRIGVVTTGGLYRSGQDVPFATPGGHVELPYRWEASPIMWRGKALSEGSNC